MPKLIVIGASQGGVEAISSIVANLPSDFPAPILFTLHTRHHHSNLPELLENSSWGRPNSRRSYGSKPKTALAIDGEPLQAGRIYMAPADYHLGVADGHIELSRSPKENWSRPAIDPMFRSAAENYGPNCIGVLLTGSNNDGTLGLFQIKRRGGIAIVQDPGEAQAPRMPQSALDNMEVDYCVGLTQIPDLLSQLAHEPDRKVGETAMPHQSANDELQKPVALTCPECGGAMRQHMSGTLLSFSCHIGHKMTAEILDNMQSESIEYLLSAAVRAFNERAELCKEMAASHQARGETTIAEQWLTAERNARTKAEMMRKTAEEAIPLPMAGE